MHNTKEIKRASITCSRSYPIIYLLLLFLDRFILGILLFSVMIMLRFRHPKGGQCLWDLILVYVYARRVCGIVKWC